MRLLPTWGGGVQLVLQILDANVKEGSAVYEEGHVLVLGWVANRKDEEVIWKILSQARSHLGATRCPLASTRCCGDGRQSKARATLRLSGRACLGCLLCRSGRSQAARCPFCQTFWQT